LAEIEASRQAKLAADHNWIPPRKQEGAGAASPAVPAFATPDTHAEPPSVVGPTLPDPLAQELRRSRHHFLMAVLIGSAWGGAVMVGAWFTIKNMSPTTKAPGVGTTIQSGPTGAGVAPEVTVEPKLGSPVRWHNDYPEIKVELYRLDDLPVAGFGEEIRLPKGTFRIKIGPRNAVWRINAGTVTAEPGETVRVSVSPFYAARFSSRLAETYYAKKDINSAIEAWRTAVTQDPKFFTAQMRLASELSMLERYREARTHVKAALELKPGNAEALELQSVLNEMEKLR